MKKSIVVFVTLAILVPVFSFAGAGKHGGFYCTKTNPDGQVTLSFIPAGANTNNGVLIVMLPKKPAVIIPNAESHWSGSMFITSGNGVFIQGPGNGVPELALLDKNGHFDPKATFTYNSDECQGL